jgi:hypothetical protein
VSRISILAVAAAGALAAVPARAEPAPLRIDYEATGGCPGAAVFLEEIQWRTSLARVAGPNEAALPVKVRIVQRGPVNSGRLVLGEGRGAITREVQDARCDEVVAALALITALAVDPRARTAPKPPPAPPAPTAPPPAATPPREPPARTAGEPAGALPPARIIGDPLPASPPPLGDAPPAPGGPRWSLGAQAVAAFAVTPRTLLGGGVFAERAFDGGGGASLRLALDLSGTGDFDVGPGGAWFLRGVVRVEGCAFARRAGPWFRLVPCLGVEGGAIEGGGILRGSLVEVRRAAVPWFGAGALPRAAFDLGAVAIEVQGGPIFPAVRRTFGFERPGYVIYTLPPVTWTTSLGVGARFP